MIGDVPSAEQHQPPPGRVRAIVIVGKTTDSPVALLANPDEANECADSSNHGPDAQFQMGRLDGQVSWAWFHQAVVAQIPAALTGMASSSWVGPMVAAA